MSLPHLPLSAPAPLPGPEAFPRGGLVAWLGEVPALDATHATLRRQGRLWTEALSWVPVPGPPPGTNPFSHRPDRHAPLRWGDPSLDRRTLDEAGAPGRFVGLVLADTLGRMPAQAARTLLSQLAERLPSGAPWLLVDRNGRYLPEVLASLRRPDAERGEGRGTVRTVEELRRLLEPPGLGLRAARGLGGRRRDRLAQRLVGVDLGAPWLVIEGSRVGGQTPPLDI